MTSPARPDPEAALADSEPRAGDSPRGRPANVQRLSEELHGAPASPAAESAVAARPLPVVPSTFAPDQSTPNWARRGADWSSLALAALVLLAGVMAIRVVRWLALRGPYDDLEQAQRGPVRSRGGAPTELSRGSAALPRDPSPQDLVQAVGRLGEPTTQRWVLANELVQSLVADPSRVDALAPSLLAEFCADSAQARDEAGFVLVEAGRRLGWRPPLAYHGPLLAALGDPDPRVSDRAVQLVLHLGPAFQASASAFADDPETTEAARAVARRALARVARESGVR